MPPSLLPRVPLALLVTASSSSPIAGCSSTAPLWSRSSRRQQSQMIRRFVSSSAVGAASSTKIVVQFRNGVPTLTVPLPSRREELCLFPMRPLTENVGILCENMKTEDRGIDFAAVYTNDGIRISASSSLEHILQMKTFRLRINDVLYDVTVEKPYGQQIGTDEGLSKLDSLRETISALHATLCLDEYKEERERRLARALEEAERELEPMEQEKNRIAHECDAHANRVMWGLFAVMGVQTGLFARLTWWEYSWDIMEPVTYFSTYLTVIGSAAYYLHTKQSFEYPLAKNRIFTKRFHKKAKIEGFDVDLYMSTVGRVERLREELKRLRDPLFHHLPIPTLERLEQTLIQESASNLIKK
ncbi:hypothetical protein PMAYCL1PPCAC_15702 [Pristionchus mayeri]|uniref:Calcium uniporter protein n=1 Tax=Pristionchus mayeri TaxID=1317129 RepID=A0AAN5HYE5_9BILA|nr:hypothetical protein PMAYCL1PPCAC_15702 [Pristionchus mayeri]